MNSFHSRSHRPHAVKKTPASTLRNGVRLDLRLVELGLAPSRAVAQRLIEAGRVQWQGQILKKPAHFLPDDGVPEVLPDPNDAFERYVSRGGVKLAGALAHCGLDVQDRICLDVGQSTGGFTDCLLQAGARRVVGVEVGKDQLHAKLRDDPRVLCLEGLNARHLSAEDLDGAMPAGGFELIVCDASFISLTLLLPRWPALLARHGDIIALVKPQFEVGPQGLAKGGIVRDASLYAGVEREIRACAIRHGLAVRDFFPSPIAGGDGNREFFIWMHHAEH